MSKTRSLILALCLIWGPLAGIDVAWAQQAGFNFLGQQFSVSIVTASNVATAWFSNPSQLPQQTGRQSCAIQYLGTTVSGSVDASLGYVFFGAAAPASVGSAFVVPNKGFINCDTLSSEVDGNAVWLAASTTGTTFVIKVK